MKVDPPAEHSEDVALAQPRRDGSPERIPSPALRPRDPFSALYAEWVHEVLRWVRAMGTREADIEDVTQEVFMVARQRMSTFDGRNPAGWLYRIAQFRVRSHRRVAWFRHLFLGQTPIEDDASEADAGPTPESALHDRERRRLLHELIERLPDSRRATFYLYEVEGYSGEEIARIQSLPVNTVWTRLHVARREFMALVARHRAETAEEEARVGTC